jgi:hypothetical protein
MELPPNEPTAHLRVNGEDREMSRYNSSLFSHLGTLAMYDHIFVSFDDEETDETITGVYIFRHNDAFEGLRDFMEDNDFPMHLNLTDVAACDLEAFEQVLESETTDINEIPDNWV